MPSLELKNPMGLIQSTLQRALELASFGLQSASLAKIESLEIPQLRTQLHIVQNPAIDIETLRNEFQSWVISNAIRDCIEAIGPSLEWARKICFLWTREGAVMPREDGSLHLEATIIGNDWNRNIVRYSKKFDRLPLPGKLHHLEEKYRLSPLPLSDEILSLNLARNCLSHRGGIVGQEDLRDRAEKGLLVKWKRLELTASGQKGERVLELPGRVEAGETISLHFASSARMVPLGERIRFLPQELIDIAFTFLLFAFQIDKSIHDLQEARRP